MYIDYLIYHPFTQQKDYSMFISDRRVQYFNDLYKRYNMIADIDIKQKITPFENLSGYLFDKLHNEINMNDMEWIIFPKYGLTLDETFTTPELFLKNKHHFNASVLDVASGGVLSVYRSVSLIMALSSKSSTPHFLIASIETACQSLNGWRAQSSSFKTRSSEPLNNSNFPYRQKSSAFMPEIFKNSAVGSIAFSSVSDCGKSIKVEHCSVTFHSKTLITQFINALLKKFNIHYSTCLFCFRDKEFYGLQYPFQKRFSNSGGFMFFYQSLTHAFENAGKIFQRYCLIVDYEQSIDALGLLLLEIKKG